SPRSEDILIATGERLSAHLLTATLRDRGIDSRTVDLTYAVPEEQGHTVDPQFFRGLQPTFAKLCEPQGGEVPVVTGFFGLVAGGLLNSIGRGYTDFTTALIAAGLGRDKADEMQVWKEVDGILTADPRRVPNARVLSSITPLEASELTYFGSEVLHPFTMERVTAARIPIRIKNTFAPDNPGTVILDEVRDRHSPVTAVTAKSGITIFSVLSNRMYNAYGFLSRVFNVLNDHGVVVDLVSTSEVSISCTAERADTVYRARADLEKLGDVSIVQERSILAMVGTGMKYAVGTAGRMFAALAGAGINIEMISQGASEINISCVIKAEDTEKALRAIHQVFLEGE
ncbi:MAG: aspartate kinase, partial [Candidatus Lambdaproteobacteria bacterium]|nr:aspartate kinase [Candidatus Lambdaproteobacteria bacterium]